MTTNRKPPKQTKERVRRAAVHRAQTATVRNYLARLNREHDGPTLAQLRAQLAQVTTAIEKASSLRRLELHPRAAELHSRIKFAESIERRDQAAEDAFVAIAADYSERNGITWRSWRAEGVPADVLRRAGVEQ